MDKRNEMKTNFKAPNLPSLDGLSDATKARIAEFNARPARRINDTRVLGWSMVEVSV